MRAWQIGGGQPPRSDGLPSRRPAHDLRPGPGQVAIRVHACSLNYRDQAIVKGRYMGGPVPTPIVPLSDGAGEVIAVRRGRHALPRSADRVAGTFFQNWVDGPPNPRRAWRSARPVRRACWPRSSCCPKRVSCVSPSR